MLLPLPFASKQDRLRYTFSASACFDTGQAALHALRYVLPLVLIQDRLRYTHYDMR